MLLYNKTIMQKAQLGFQLNANTSIATLDGNVINIKWENFK